MVNKIGNPKRKEPLISLRMGVTQKQKDLLGPDGFRSYHLRIILDEYPGLKAENEQLKKDYGQLMARLESLNRAIESKDEEA